MHPPSKLTLAGGRVAVGAETVAPLLQAILTQQGVDAATAQEIADHLIETELSGIESHGVMRVLQYADQYQSGYLRAAAAPRLVEPGPGRAEIDGGGGIGIPAMRMAVAHATARALRDGMAALPVRNVGHTGRLGAFAEHGADRGCLILIVGGGGRQNWRQVAPYGGTKALLPTNPYCLAMPGGRRGPVVVDFATSVIAGGWLYAARVAGAEVPDGAIIDAAGRPSRDPEAYFNGGAILPKGGVMGYGLGLMAELICEAMLGPVGTEVNWLVLAIDTARYREPHRLQTVAEEILAELRACPPAPGRQQVEIPGERERQFRADNPQRILRIPKQTWVAILARAA